MDVAGRVAGHWMPPKTTDTSRNISVTTSDTTDVFTCTTSRIDGTNDKTTGGNRLYSYRTYSYYYNYISRASFKAYST